MLYWICFALESNNCEKSGAADILEIIYDLSNKKANPRNIRCICGFDCGFQVFSRHL